MSLGARGACGLYYSYQVRDRSGKILVPFRRRTAHSFLIGYARWLQMKVVGTGRQTVTDTTGNSRSLIRSSALTSEASAAVSTLGLVAGTGTNAVALADAALQTQIAHGTTSGTLSYGASVVNAPASDSTSTELILTRVFANASGGLITVREIGIYSNMEYDNGSTAIVCTVRDTVTIALADADQLTLNYILKTTS